jgi:hypothetical protein
MSKYEHYKETKRLASLLVQDGAKGYSDLLLDAMVEGATSSEIGMALKWHVKNILKLDSISKETRECARRLHKELNKALQACD